MVIDLIISLLIFVFGFLLVLSIKISKRDKRNLNLLWVYHYLFSIVNFLYLIYNGGDTLMFWKSAHDMSPTDFINILTTAYSSSQGTRIMGAINYIPVNLMGMSFFSTTILYSIFGFIAFIFLYRICIQVIPYNSKFYKYKLFPLLFFLPNLHFWSSGPGKDTLLFLCISMVAFGFMRTYKRFLLIIFGLLLSFAIRPHVTLILLLSFGFAYVINHKISVPQRIFLVLFIAVAAALIIPSVLKFTSMDELSMDELNRFSNTQAGNLSVAGSGVDLSSYPYPLKVLTFLYRPFFFDINGIPAVVASFENLLLLLLSIKVVRSRFVTTFRAAPLVVQGLFLFFLMGALVFSMSMSNLGIILRERNMFLPGLILFILWSFSYKQELVMKKKKNIFSTLQTNKPIKPL